jgi:hypothetical protein
LDVRGSPVAPDANHQLLLRAGPTRSQTAGLGEGLSFDFGGLAGTALAHEDELLALTAFVQDEPPSDGAGPSATARVARPSRRRRS